MMMMKRRRLATIILLSLLEALQLQTKLKVNLLRLLLPMIYRVWTPPTLQLSRTKLAMGITISRRLRTFSCLHLCWSSHAQKHKMHNQSLSLLKADLRPSLRLGTLGHRSSGTW